MNDRKLVLHASAVALVCALCAVAIPAQLAA